MAEIAAYCGSQVHAVREIDKIRKVMNLYPWDGLLPVPVAEHLFHLGPLRRDIDMTGAAGVHIRHARNRGDFCMPVTEQAVNAVLSRMNPVAEIYWLFRRTINDGRGEIPYLGHDVQAGSHKGRGNAEEQ